MIPPSNYGYGYINRFFWQKGLLHLATFIHNEYKSKNEVTICDGNIRTIEECILVLRNNHFDIIGFYCLDHTRENCQTLINEAIALKVERLFLGGPGAISSYETFVETIPLFDKSWIAVCRGQGEPFLQDYLHLETSVGNRILLPPVPKWDLSLYNENEMKGLYFEAYQNDLERYIINQIGSSDFPYKPITYSTMSHIGCIHRSQGGGCYFCGIPHRFYHRMNGELFWRDFRNFQKFVNKKFVKYGYSVNSIKDWGDSMSKPVLRELLRTRPSEFQSVEYSCYLSCQDISNELLDMLEKLNCKSVYLGLDGTGYNSLTQLSKGYSLDKMIDNLYLLKKYPFKLEIGVILGVQNETVLSLEETVTFCKWLCDFFGSKIIVIQGNVMIPMSGSLLMNDLIDTYRKRHGDVASLMRMKIPEKTRQWLELFTHVTFKDCLVAQKRIEEFSPRRHSYVSNSLEGS